MPGARTYWQGRQWNWEAWDGAGKRESGTANRRADALGKSEKHALDYAGERKLPIESLYEASRERGTKLAAAAQPSPTTEPQQQPNIIIEPTQFIAAAKPEKVAPAVEETPEETVDPSILDALRAVASSHVRPLRELLGTDTEHEGERDADAEETTAGTDFGYGLGDDGERAV